MIDNNFDSVQFDRKRKRILDVVRSEKITSINQLARRLNRHVKWLPGFKITLCLWLCEFKKDGRKVVLTVPYTRLKIEIPIGKTDASLDRALRTFSLCLRNLSSLLTSSPP